MSTTEDPSTNPSDSPSDGERPTTTHAEWGAGNPRLVFNVGEEYDGSPAREFALVDDVVIVGSAESAQLRLEGLEPEHARIVHEDDDEYVLDPLGDVAVGSEGQADDPAPERHVLRSGAKVQLGSWSMFFTRDESADHGRPHGGRVGGELAHQKSQPERPDYAEH
jgi:hypothetical protein